LHDSRYKLAVIVYKIFVIPERTLSVPYFIITFLIPQA
jgi:hypothetical protein